MSELLEVKNLSVSFFTPEGEVQAVRDVSFSLRAGEVRELGGGEGIAGILGRNVLGWFGREPDPGGRKYLYHVTEKGLAALEEYRELL